MLGEPLSGLSPGPDPARCPDPLCREGSHPERIPAYPGVLILMKMELCEDLGTATQHCPTLLLPPALLTAGLALGGPAEALSPGWEPGRTPDTAWRHHTRVPGVSSSSGNFTMARQEKKTPEMWQKQLCKSWHCTRAGHGELGGIFQLHI